ncbi:beta-glucosidase [Cellulophaga baltica]|uniref:GH1 family beta-glucosidase n=1 Tax=Cellulophaga TaxID=104264 RepID=UPI001C0692EE|nr:MULTISPECIES: GH1 family beta-glucosidase [Cellulophaga]MBU2995345.1 beta-glucosidase [Cellulophaga baltica]MDO6766740.1 GH1 family beta-glucosidase [Cellulophaga sp. 1_MG-2023]
MNITSSLKKSKLSRKNFGEDFVWGVSVAAYQIEGAHDVDDKGESIWDNFTKKKGAIYKNEHAQVSCDFYHKYQEDILLLKKMNIKEFRFSLSWSRIIPNGVGEVSEKGVEFYNNVINFCLEHGITPWVTLYHWDLPQALEDKGGWTNREVVNWFKTFSTVCAKHFGDRVKKWMVLNEPMVFTGAGYFLGVHAPGKKGLKNFLPAVHHAVLCQAAGGRILRELVADAFIGTTFSCSYITPVDKKHKNIVAAKKADAMLNRLFIEPSLGLGYPFDAAPVLKKIKNYIQPGDEKNAIFEFDFIGIQNYTREVVKHSYLVPYLSAKIVEANKRNVRTTMMNWEVYPKSIFKMIKQFNEYKGVNKIIITENGAAFKDVVENGEVDDIRRVNFLKAYLKQVYKAKRKGLKIDGYFVWTFMDNFEWAEGYKPRFGLVHIDFETQKRIVKASGKWYTKFLSK